MSEPAVKKDFAVHFAHLPSYMRFGGAVLVAVVARFLLPQSWPEELRLVATWDAFAATAIAFVWYTMLSLEPTHIRQVARIEDPSRALTLILVVVGAAAALLAVVVLLESSMGLPTEAKVRAIILALSAVVLAWGLIHTVFTLRYAHMYHGSGEAAHGLTFPGDEACPEYLDFAYFSFVIGMTAQTSDVGITHRKMRTVVWLHGMISFAFNTAVVALSIGVLSTLFQPKG